MNCEQALEDAEARVLLAIENHTNGVPEDLSISMLEEVRRDLMRCRQVEVPLSYPRFVLDWPENHGLVTYLLEVAELYGKCMAKRRSD